MHDSASLQFHYLWHGCTGLKPDPNVKAREIAFRLGRHLQQVEMLCSDPMAWESIHRGFGGRWEMQDASGSVEYGKQAEWREEPQSSAAGVLEWHCKTVPGGEDAVASDSTTILVRLLLPLRVD